ncbi:MAG: amino acid ABC transporter permease [Chloroflexi bacterium]|nr:amino acid ABC transporter permease [Chloroflexota bacterium]
MANERTKSDQTPSSAPPLSDEPPDDGLVRPGPYERLIDRAAKLPWWAIILVIVAAAVLYSMLSSVAYRRVIQRLTDDPQTSTTDLFEVVQIVGSPTMVVGRYVGETSDSVETIIDILLADVIDNETVTHSGFILAETPAAITLRVGDEAITVLKSQIVSEERTEDRDGTQITLSYIDRVTVTGVLTEQNDDTMKIRTVDEISQTFAAARILSRETQTIPCDKEADPNCQDRELVTIQRQGEILDGTLRTLSATNLNIRLPDGTSREIRQSDVEYLYVPTLTIAVNQSRAGAPVQPGEEVRVAFVEGTDITKALDELNASESIPVPLRYVEGEARVALVAYPDLDSALRAVGANEVSGMVYLDSGPNRMAVQEWLAANANSGVVLPTPPRECIRDCAVTVKLIDDEIGGRVLSENADDITIVTTEAEYVVIDKDKILDNRRMEPGLCALNNLRGCNAGIFLTLRVTFSAYGLALVFGLIFGLLRVQTNPVLYAISTLYVEVVRGIPLLVILLYAGFVVSPWLRDNTPLRLGDEQEAVMGLAFGYGAFVAEIFRAGIQSISRGQMEAARSLGMSYPEAMRYVVLPQAVRVVLPPLGNDFIAMLKDSALISVLALPDLLQLGRLYVSRTYRAFEGYNTVAFLYLLMTLFLSSMVRIIERRTRLPK